MEEPSQWRLYRGAHVCSRMLSSSTVLIEAAAGNLSCDTVPEDIVDTTLKQLQHALNYLHAGVAEARRLLPDLQSFAESMCAAAGQPALIQRCSTEPGTLACTLT
jgi:hypothetical protein